MPRLFVDDSIDIDAPAYAVWKAITDPVLSKQWVKEFSPEIMSLSSDWKIGSAVLWNDIVNTPIVEGKVTANQEHELLRFTVMPVGQKPEVPFKEEDGITFKLHETEGQTYLSILHGDFGLTPEHKLFHDISEQTWKRVLPIIKRLAEQ